MRTIAHIISPVEAPATSDLVIAQPITFATMRTACLFASPLVDVRLFAVKLADEQPDMPAGFNAVPDLTRSARDLNPGLRLRRLPLIQDILERLYTACPEAEYLIYTNVDIALQPHFYLAVNGLIDQGYDALTINRRTISAELNRLEQIPLMYAQVGRKHGGHDCFIFKRSAYPNFYLGDICIGSGGIGTMLGLNLAYQAQCFKVCDDLHLTFHIGYAGAWRSTENKDELTWNLRQVQQVTEYLRQQYPDFSHPFQKKARGIERWMEELLLVRQPTLRGYLARLRRSWRRSRHARKARNDDDLSQ